jgi:enoyl-[acyl-carrier protein] reductase II
VVGQVDVPVIAAGGFLDGPTMAAGLALGAEGVQLGTAMVSCAESPIHDNWKQAVVDAAETDTVFLNQHTSPAMRALRTEKSGSYQFDTERNAMLELLNQDALYFGGDMEASLALCGQVAGRIDEVRPVADIIADCANGCTDTLAALADRYVSG